MRVIIFRSIFFFSVYDFLINFHVHYSGLKNDYKLQYKSVI